MNEDDTQNGMGKNGSDLCFFCHIRLFFLQAVFVFTNKGAQFGVVIFLAIEGIVERAFRMFFRHKTHSFGGAVFR